MVSSALQALLTSRHQHYHTTVRQARYRMDGLLDGRMPHTSNNPDRDAKRDPPTPPKRRDDAVVRTHNSRYDSPPRSSLRRSPTDRQTDR
mmetsp:Transcript_17715/g.31294  ORF Transcript_17715/g.31294 Transcript_17715/m.31294 type:complete len:90 (-) Transcript_17715:508-777(-)